MCFNFQKVSKSRDRHGDMTADDVMWVGRAVRKGRRPLRSSKLLGPRGLALARTRARWFRINMWALQACKCEIPLIWANSGDWVPNWKLLTEKKMYKFRVRCALFKDLTCNRPSLLHTVTILLDINGGTFNFIRTPFFGVFLQHAYNMFLIGRSRLNSPRMLRMFPR